jgi:hypothetical protein
VRAATDAEQRAERAAQPFRQERRARELVPCTRSAWDIVSTGSPRINGLPFPPNSCCPHPSGAA